MEWIFARYIGNQTFETESTQYFILGDTWDDFYNTSWGCIDSTEQTPCFNIYYKIRVENGMVKEIEKNR